MNTVYNKAVVAALGGLVQLLNLWVDVSWLNEGMVASIAGVLTMVLVYFVPNKE